MHQQDIDFSQRIIAWYKKNGRKNLPWQHKRTPYKVWVSEIMLQQTQVATVIPYFQRFMALFPDLTSLANADVDAVLSVWTGLGYYTRARNLHSCAQQVMTEFGGEFPKSVDELQSLAGIGRSTAGAIRALGHGLPASILDGNVKRVLSRFALIEGWPGNPAVQRELWKISEDFTPKKSIAAYTQGMMDLGATVCTRSKPSCEECPLQSHCGAYHTGRMQELPHKKPKKVLPVKYTKFILLVDAKQRILLQKRPPTGIWGGLWSFPEAPDQTRNIAKWCVSCLGYNVHDVDMIDAFRHTFSHFHLQITACLARAEDRGNRVMDSNNYSWYSFEQALTLGLPAPVKRLITQLKEMS